MLKQMRGGMRACGVLLACVCAASTDYTHMRPVCGQRSLLCSCAAPSSLPLIPCYHCPLLPQVRNSWGTYWGELGFFKVQRGVNALQIESGDCW